jgi:thioredoxin-dependent peroxiredoxin
MTVKEGDRLPDFSLEADDGTVVTPQSLAGKKVVLFFYPKDNTAG